MSDLFSALKKNINKGISTVSEKSSQMLEIAKLKGQLAKLEEQQRDLLAGLGSCVYETYGNAPLDGECIAAKCEEIRAVEAAIAEKAAELQTVLEGDKQGADAAGGAANCECGAELQPGAKFCAVCGKKTAATAKCECGAELQPGAKFCLECGKRVGN